MADVIGCVLSVCLAFALPVGPQARGWRGLVPMQSTRADVEKLLGPSADDGYGVAYDLGGEAVTFEYSSGPCTKRRKGGWNLPVDTVIRIRVSASVKPRFSALDIDREKLKKIENTELPGVEYYVDSEKGIYYEVQGGLVITTEYGPAPKDNPLRCPEEGP
jgi:hypothetical protein